MRKYDSAMAAPNYPAGGQNQEAAEFSEVTGVQRRDRIPKPSGPELWRFIRRGGSSAPNEARPQARGEIVLRATVTEKTTVGVAFIACHFAEAAANLLTNDALDPEAKIPKFKACAGRCSLRGRRSWRIQRMFW